MKLRIRLNEKAPFVIVVAIIALASVVLAYVEEERIAEAADVRIALAQAEAQLAGLPRQPEMAGVPAQSGGILKAQALLPVFILLGGLGLALLVFIAFYTLWRSDQAGQLNSTEQRLSLARSKERLRSIFENAGDGICGLNLDGEIIFANPAAAGILDTQSESLTGEVFTRFLEQPSDNILLDPSHQASSNAEIPLKTATGRKLMIELTATPMRNHTGAVSGTVAIFRDVTERVKTERDLREANSELEEFAYRTSHDLRSPLVSAVALMKIVSGSLEQGRVEAASKGVRLTISALEGLERLVEDIHLLSRTRAEQEDDAPIDLAALAQGALDRHTYLDGYDRLSIETEFQAGTEFSSKPRRADLIVNNLISNAIKYQDPEQSDPALRISTYPKENGILLVVEDNGLGIPHDQREHLFSMFKRFHPEVSFGSGLGLYMVKKSADIIGAQLTCEPCHPGTRFTVLFPADPAPTKPATERTN